MWTLIFVVLIGNDVEATVVGTYPTMNECFASRETLSIKYGNDRGYFKSGSQAICVYGEVDSI